MNLPSRDRVQSNGRPADHSEVTAVLGPTNTGKTHLAVERMLGHASGMIGLPLRLLAREIYDRVANMRGAAAVALITGEEKILPPRPAYYVCTVESMPTAIQTDFLAVDEIQLCADADRGHIFTDRLLHARGKYETMFLGSETMRQLIRQLLPATRFVTRPRFSRLSYAGSHKLSRMPRRSAIVAFSADEVYGIAELIRRKRGGAAVIMGALSPRTRNAQAALYQSGEVDFLVATDAIGMGVNMDVNHIAFASLGKFDGFAHRDLRATEIAQIAGRAGRYLNDGTFGVTGEAGPLGEHLITQVENHQFEPLRQIKWRNSSLQFGSLDLLIRSLEAQPVRAGLSRTRENEDLTALRLLSSDRRISQIASSPAAVKQLWQVCQVPDFRKLGADLHGRQLSELYLQIMGRSGVAPEDYMARNVERLDSMEGDIDALSARIAQMRFWAFVANRSGWLRDSNYWRGRTRAIEDRLSDALHARLTQRFIDRRTSVLMRRLHQKEDLMSSLTPGGDVMVEGEFVGRLDGFRFSVDPSVDSIHASTLRNAAQQALQGEIGARAFRLERHARIDEGKIIAIGDDGLIRWEGMVVAKLAPTQEVLKPRIELLADEDLLSGQAEYALREALEGWLIRRIRAVLEPLLALQDAPDLEGLGKGLAFQLAESLGILPRKQLSDLLKGLDQGERAKLRKLGVRFGEHHVYLPALLKPAPAAMKVRLWRVHNRIASPLAPPPAGLSSLPVDPQTPAGFYLIAGFEVCGPRAVRIDMLERLLQQLRQKNNAGPFPISAELWSPVGCSKADFENVLRSLGYAPVITQTAPVTDDVAEEAPPLEKAAAPETENDDVSPEPDMRTPEVMQEDPSEELTSDSAQEAGEEAPVLASEESLSAPMEGLLEALEPVPPAVESVVQVLWKYQSQRKIHFIKPRRQPDRKKRPASETVLLDPEVAEARARARDEKRSKEETKRGREKPRQKSGPHLTRNLRAASHLAEKRPLPARAEKPVDPDSPFAKLQALKDRMQKSL